MAVFMFGTVVTLYLGAGAIFPVDKALTLGLF
jgi:cytochrome b6-f complex subunit 4